jgi:3-dehydroquinate synthase
MNTNFYFKQEEQLLLNRELHEMQPIIIADARTNGFCVQKAIGLLPALKYAPIIVLPAGEENKNIEVVQFAWQQLMAIGANKKNIIINIGGGTLCDIGGFVASTYMRGLPFINIPTTLLAMNDASFGGKNGFNMLGTKNIIGTIQLPNAVYINPIFLETLSEREIKSGIAEIIKHALIADQNMWEEIIYTKDLMAYGTLLNTIKKSIAIKTKIVAEDLNDNNQRQALNFGHTIGHAIEALSHEQQKPLLHGEAVLLGMIMELQISEQKFQLPSEVRKNLTAIKNKWYPMLQYHADYEACKKYLDFDKKNARKNNFALIKAVGEPAVKNEIDFLEAIFHEASY